LSKHVRKTPPSVSSRKSKIGRGEGDVGKRGGGNVPCGHIDRMCQSEGTGHASWQSNRMGGLEKKVGAVQDWLTGTGSWRVYGRPASQRNNVEKPTWKWSEGKLGGNFAQTTDPITEN